jgi:hypothetical protein
MIRDHQEVVDIGALKKRAQDLEDWLKEKAPESFVEQKHAEEDTQERIYWHHGYMMGLRDALRLLAGDEVPSLHTRS